uniref:ATP synthase F0 subunit 8 n=1 Tax=Hutchinsoniella macracantha TaxID=84335 RepID=Q6SL02_9CRUS|nr:ATP synthase F0 subunit 8 [Hutchinsoniella macracantha]
MPQMFPLLWFFLFISFIFFVVSCLCYIYYFIFYMSDTVGLVLKSGECVWKW